MTSEMTSQVTNTWLSVNEIIFKFDAVQIIAFLSVELGMKPRSWNIDKVEAAALHILLFHV